MESQVVHHVCLYFCFIILSVCISVYLLCCCYSYNTYNLVRDWNPREYDVRTVIGTKTKKPLIKPR